MAIGLTSDAIILQLTAWVSQEKKKGMSEALSQKTTYTFEEYLELEKTSPERLEFYFGEIYALAGSSKRHNKLIRAISNQIHPQLDPSICDSFFTDIKIEIFPKGKYLYPDFVITCDEDDLKDDENGWVKNPSLIVEVLSKGTEDNDRNQKFKSYTQIPSLKYYLLVSQEQKRIEVYSRQPHDFWQYKAYEESIDLIPLPELNINLDFEAVYQNITFSEEV